MKFIDNQCLQFHFALIYLKSKMKTKNSMTTSTQLGSDVFFGLVKHLSYELLFMTNSIKNILRFTNPFVKHSSIYFSLTLMVTNERKTNLMMTTRQK